MAECKGLVGSRSICKYFLVNFTRFLRFGKIGKEVGTGKFFACVSGNVGHCFIHIGDLAFSINSN